MSREMYERGTILDTLRRNRGLEMPLAFMQLLKTLDLLSLPMTPRALRENLEYLSAKGYVELKRRRDLPGFSLTRLQTDEQADHIVTVKLTAKAMDLLEGTIQDVGIFV